MGREIKRVALDFDWPMNMVWRGYLPECDCEDEHECEWKDFEPPAGDGWQAWENVSDGSPVTPVFATAEGLAYYLVSTGVSRAAADAFVEVGWVPSMIVKDGAVFRAYEAAPFMKRKAP